MYCPFCGSEIMFEADEKLVFCDCGTTARIKRFDRDFLVIVSKDAPIMPVGDGIDHVCNYCPFCGKAELVVKTPVGTIDKETGEIRYAGTKPQLECRRGCKKKATLFLDEKKNKYRVAFSEPEELALHEVEITWE